MPRVFIRHKTGSKAGQDEILDFIGSREVLIGRDRETCALAYDENLDETVSRKHARIVQNPSAPNLFTIENFSGNGTFVNGRKIDSPTPLSHGSTVKFGQSGPSFVFEIDPPPVSSGPKLTVMDFGGVDAAAPRVSIKHQTGSKAPQTESLDFSRAGGVLIGRDPACTVAYDENRDETVSREHARIVRNPGGPNLFTIENLSQSNGTFVDGIKIDAPTPLNHGSLVKFGASGPSFVFELDPPPSKATKFDFGPVSSAKGPAKAGPWWDPRQTMMGQGKAGHWWDRRQTTILEADPESEGRWNLANILFVFAIAVFAAVTAFAIFLFVSRPKDGADILKANGPAVVSIETTWRLFDPESGRQAYHWHVQYPIAQGSDGAAVNGQTRLPVFVRMAGGGIEPVLILDDEKDTNLPVGGRVSGSGCVIHENGFVLTGSSVAAPFGSLYDWSHEALPALLIDPADHTVSRMNQFPADWAPAAARFVITRRTTVNDVRLGRVESTGRRLEGKLDAIAIGFSGSEKRLNAKLVGMSANNRMALFKADALQPLPSVAINGARARLAVAGRAYLLGYSLGPAAAKKPVARLASVVKVAGATSSPSTAICPGCYGISESGVDAGFAGGPVFDDHGRFAGVFLLQGRVQDKTLSVVPVEQAADLLGLSLK